MSNEYSAQGSITIKRLRNGDTLFLTFDNNGIPLYQGVDPTSGAVSPDWTVPANQPTRIPKVTSTRGASVSLSHHAWAYNGNALVFNGAQDGNYVKDSTGMFEMNTSTGELKIIANLASTVNYANDTLTYSCTATVNGLESNLSKSIDVTIQSVGASSYVGLLVATTEQISEAVPTAQIASQLMLGTSSLTNYYIKWYKEDLNHEWTDKAGQKTVTVTRDDVNGTTLFIAEFYANQSDTASVYRAAIRIIDTGDEFQIVYSITSDNKMVDEGQNVTVTGKIVNMHTSAVLAPTSAVWTTEVMDTKTWVSTQSVQSNEVIVTTADTDTDHGQNDVEVVGNVDWNE
jgi:hypothetical protein